MKRLTAVAALSMLIALSGCAPLSQVQPGRQSNTSLQYATTTAGVEELALVSMNNPVRRGSAGSLTLQGKAGVRYTVTAVYNRSAGTETATKIAKAGPDGIVSLVWMVSKDTLPGTYRIIVKGGGKMLTTAYTVTE